MIGYINKWGRRDKSPDIVSKKHWRNLTNTTSVKWSKMTTAVINHVDITYPLYDVISLSIIHNPIPIMRKTPNKFPW